MRRSTRDLRRLPMALLLAGSIWPFATAVPARADSTEIDDSGEVILYRWRLQGISGLLARLLPGIPASGEGELSTRSAGEDRTLCRFRATSPKAKDDEYWAYTAEIDTTEARTLRVVDSFSFRGKHKEKTYDLTDQDVIDVLSGLHLLSRSVPEVEEQTTIWSDRKTYPVVVTPHGIERRQIEGREMDLLHVSIRGIKEGERRHWKSRADIWFSAENPATPVEILFRQSLGQLHMVQVNGPQTAGPQGSGPTENRAR